MDQQTFTTISVEKHIEAFKPAFITTVNQCMECIFQVSHLILMGSEHAEQKKKFNETRLKLYNFAKAHKDFAQLKSYLVAECNYNMAELQFGNLGSVETFLDMNEVLNFCIEKHEIQENYFYEDYIYYPSSVFKKTN